MTSGLGYGCADVYKPIMRGIKKRSISSLKAFCEELAKLPLLSEPGRAYEYGFSTDVLGHVCEVVSGERLDKFVEKRLLRPLGMADTHFIVPKSKRKRMAVLYDAGREVPAKKQRGARQAYLIKQYVHPDSAPGIMSAGGGVSSYRDAGMFSTLRDYVQFCQMLLNGGVGMNGRRILRAGTVRMLWADGLAPYARRGGRVPGWNDSGGNPRYWDRVGWSLLNTHVVFDEQPRKGGAQRRPKTMFMGGGGGTYWYIDPGRKLAALSFTQCFGGRVASDGSDGHGPRANDAAIYAVAAADGTEHVLAHEYGAFGPPGILPSKLNKSLVVRLPVEKDKSQG